MRSDQIDRRAPGLERDGGGPGTASAAHRSPVVFRKQVIEVPRGAVGFALVHPEDAAVLGHAALRERHRHIQVSAVAHRGNVRYLKSTVGPKQVFSEERGIDAVARRLRVAGAVVAAVGHDIGAQIGDNGGSAGHIVSHPIVRARQAKVIDAAGGQLIPVLAHVDVVRHTVEAGLDLGFRPPKG